MTGRKDDQDKTRWDLIPWEQMEEVANVLTSGAKKYGDNNWAQVEDAPRRYFAAAMRHLVAWQQGEAVDAESGRSPLAHAVCCLLFLMWCDEYYEGGDK